MVGVRNPPDTVCYLDFSDEDKMKLAFEIYDFDNDGYIDKEDVRLVMSHIPVDSAVKKEMEGEGRFT